jgi:type IV pilus assembly protein PilY1
VDFTAANMAAADLGVATFTSPGSPPDPAPNSSLYLFEGSAAMNEEGLTDEIVQYTRGCTFGTGVVSGDIDGGGTACVDRATRLGDIFHSAPKVVGKPKSVITDSSYQTFKSTYSARKRRLYAGANDGFMHAFDAGDWDATNKKYLPGTGAEVFGFMPWEVRQNIKELPVDDPAAREYYVDGSASAADVWFYPTPGAVDADKTAAQWHTILTAGLRQGGRHYYALDITDPTGSAVTYPNYLWEFPTEADPDGNLAYMGEAWGVPVLTRVKVDYAGTTVERSVVIVTGGYDATGDPNSPSYDVNATAGRAIFMLDAKTGEVLAEKKLTPGSGDIREKMVYSIASTPGVYDIDFDSYADVVYVGDLGGNLWKWAISDVGDDPVNEVGDDVNQPNWEFGIFFQAPAARIAGIDYYKSLYTTPAAALLKGKLYISFGTGERHDLGFAGVTTSTAENNKLYVLTDVDPTEQVAGFELLDEATDLQDVGSTEGCSSITSRGYYFGLADGEKIVTSTDIFAGLVIAASFKPVASLDPCTSRGEANLYIFSLSCGEGYFDDGGNPSRDLSIGVGFPTDPQVSLGVGGSDNRIYIEMGDAGDGLGGRIESPDPLPDTGGGELLYWREMP